MFTRRTLLATTTLTSPVAAAVSGVSGVFYGLKYLGVQATFVYGSGGTDLKVWIQTSFDEAATWIDIMNFRFLTTSLRRVASVVVRTPVTTIYTALDGALANDSVKDGLLGDRLRVKYTSTGTYAGGTTITIDAVPKA